MRIVGGKYKGRTLLEFKGQDIRPTSDMVRESLFNILQFKILDKNFLDLFCGTGAVGIEALSRGAKSVTFNDASRTSLELTKKNLLKLGIEQGYNLTNRNGVDFANGCLQRFDYIFVDPPYNSDLGVNSLKTLSEILDEDGVVVYESEQPLKEEIDGLCQYDQRKYGRAYLTFLKRR